MELALSLTVAPVFGTARGWNMRFVTGMIFGALLTIVAAYWHDADVRDARARLVNWDVADRIFSVARQRAQDDWDRLTKRDHPARNEEERL